MYRLVAFPVRVIVAAIRCSTFCETPRQYPEPLNDDPTPPGGMPDIPTNMGYKERPKRKKCEQEDDEYDRGPFHVSLRRKRDTKRSRRRKSEHRILETPRQRTPKNDIDTTTSPIEPEPLKAQSHRVDLWNQPQPRPKRKDLLSPEQLYWLYNRAPAGTFSPKRPVRRKIAESSSSPKQQSNVRIVDAHVYYQWFHTVRCCVLQHGRSDNTLRHGCLPHHIVFLLHLKWITLEECLDWAEGRAYVGEGLLEFAEDSKNGVEWRINEKSRLPSEEELRRYISSWTKFIPPPHARYDWQADSLDRKRYGPFGQKFSLAGFATTKELVDIAARITNAEECADSICLPDELATVLRPLIESKRKQDVEVQDPVPQPEEELCPEGKPCPEEELCPEVEDSENADSEEGDPCPEEEPRTENGSLDCTEVVEDSENADSDTATQSIETWEGQQVAENGTDLRSDRTAPPPSPKMVPVMISLGREASPALSEETLSSTPLSTVLDLPSTNPCPSEEQSQPPEDCTSEESKDSDVIEVPLEDSDMEDCFVMQQPTEAVWTGGLAAMDCDCDWTSDQNNVDDKDVEMAPISAVDFDASDSDPRKMSIDSINPEPSNIWNFSQPVPFNLPTVDEEMQDAGPIYSNPHPQSWVWDNKHRTQDPSSSAIEMQDATHITAEARPDMQSIHLVISLTPPTPAAPTPAPSIQFLSPKPNNVAPTQSSSTVPAVNVVTSLPGNRSQPRQGVVPSHLATPPSPKPPIPSQTAAVAPRRQRANALLAPVTGDIDSKSKTQARRNHQRSASADFALGIGAVIRDAHATLPDYVSDDEQESSYASAGPGPSSYAKAKGKLKAEPLLPTPESSPPRNNMVSSSVTAEPEEFVSTYDKPNADEDVHGLELDYGEAEEPKSKPPSRYRITSQDVDEFFASVLSPSLE
ncbi:uncharacterized protein FOMMEDRAFT_170465 [Fomitiporia mediterranea MF3/22]|uniref:uncharacterized protein n=1 Tax=Fomitiporia mediterranea (strain MF3/22) TaxID=694068 RepID=UPI00044079C6|nr:uncharacterized protein FOMMEDRAFT_170465 [Fomitiporia mediterranea MF3/22]EJC99543.1 hypothetical protein FOMMEDRAFT_170465 [Fomitiporia mediterranea MF3/22]